MMDRLRIVELDLAVAATNAHYTGIALDAIKVSQDKMMAKIDKLQETRDATAGSFRVITFAVTAVLAGVVSLFVNMLSGRA